MNKMFLFSFLWITCVIPSLFGSSLGNSSCELNIGDCKYKLALLPSNKCQGHSFSRSRSKRSEVNGHETNEIVHKMTSLESEFKKLEGKLVKEMVHLSKRVLRGARKMESLAKSSAPEGQEEKKSRCPEGFRTFGDWPDCYLFSTFNATWYNARDYCNAMDSELVALESQKEHFLVSFQIQNNQDIRNAKGWWTSGTYKTPIKKWMWMDDSNFKPVAYTNWAVNEPNDELDMKIQCIMMYKLDDLLWHDQICTDKYNFICEKSVVR